MGQGHDCTGDCGRCKCGHAQHLHPQRHHRQGEAAGLVWEAVTVASGVRPAREAAKHGQADNSAGRRESDDSHGKA